MVLNMIPEQVKNFCIEVVSVHKGIIGTHLVLLLGSKFLYLDNKMLRTVPAILSQEGKLVEIEYVIPGQPSQSLFLPVGTVVKGVSNG